MGDCGHYDAELSVEFSLKRAKGKNTKEEVKGLTLNTSSNITLPSAGRAEFIKKLFNKLLPAESLSLTYEDWWETSSDTGIGFIAEAFEEYYEDEETWRLAKITPTPTSVLRTLDLVLMSKYKIKELRPGCTHIICVDAVSESIYCDNDNSTSTTINMKKLTKLLEYPKAQLILSGDGSGNC